MSPMNNGRTHVYPLKKGHINIKRVARTKQAYNTDVVILRLQKKRNKSVASYRGIKGTCELGELAHFSPVESTAIDYMHSILYGVLLKLMEVWFTKKYEAHPSSLFKKLSQLDEKLLAIEPPSFVSRAPRSLKEIHMYKAHELFAFLLYYSIIICFQV